MSLVTRNHPKLTLEGARSVLVAAQQHANDIQVPMDIAVVDEGGHLIVFERMDGARPSSIAIAIVKAQAAAARRAATGPAMDGDQVNVTLSLGIAIASPAEQIPILGGVPLIVDGQVIGGIGVSAGKPEQDFDVARAGARVIEKA